MTDEEFEAFIGTCYREFEAKQQAMEAQGLGTYERFWFDQETRKLQFFNDNELKKEWPFVVIGTWAHQKDDWLWGWANQSFLEPIRSDSAACKQIAEITGFDFATAPQVQADEKMAYEMVAMAMHVLSAVGMYRVPGKTSHMFLALL